MIRTRLNPFLYLLLWLAMVLLPAWVYAQSAVGTAVNGIQVREGNDYLELDVYLTLDRIVSGVAPLEAELLLEDGSRYQAQLSRPHYYVALALDVSGSMKTALPTVRETAVALVQQAPLQTFFAVITFDEGIHLVQPFTDNHDQVIAAINSVAIGENGTCLYDATFTAIQALNQIAGQTPRRALALFTDGRDERRQGESDLCSQNSLEEIIAYASASAPLPIYVAGLPGSPAGVERAPLEQMAAATGGQVADKAQLPSLAQAVLDNVNRQWLAQVQPQPGRGEQRGALFLTLNDKSLPTPLPVAFVTSRSFLAPLATAVPPAVSIDSLRYDLAANELLLEVAASSLPEGSSLRIDVLDGNNLRVARLTPSGPIPPRQTVRLNASPLTAGEAYTLQLVAVNPSGWMLTDENGRSLNATYPFTYNPPRPPQLTIDNVQQIAQPAVFNFRTWRMVGGADLLQVNLHIANGEPVAQYEGHLVSLPNNQQWGDPFTLTLVNSRDNGRLTAQVPMKLDNGNYTLVLHAVDADGQRLTSARYDNFSAADTPPKRFFRSAQANMLLWLVGWAGFMVLTFLVWRTGLIAGQRSSQPRQERPTPPAPVGPPIVRLEVLETPDPAFSDEQRVLVLREFPFMIGREGCNWNFAGDRHVSRRHARISRTDGIFYLTDLGSSNGTFINEARIEANEPILLSSDSEAQIRLGKTTLISFAEGNSE